MPLYTTSADIKNGLLESLGLLEAHYVAFSTAVPAAKKWGHTAPVDTKSWSQILVSAITGLSGLSRKKGADLEDGSDVKGANCWEAIDTPRFNGCLPAGRKSVTSAKPLSLKALADIPYLFFVLWDTKPVLELPRFRVWITRPNTDPAFRKIAKSWYEQRESGDIISDNFQLHPPRNTDSNVIRNSCGNLDYPLLISAVRTESVWQPDMFDWNVLHKGLCRNAP
jgi:hypothetical protein